MASICLAIPRTKAHPRRDHTPHPPRRRGRRPTASLRGARFAQGNFAAACRARRNLKGTTGRLRPSQPRRGRALYRNGRTGPAQTASDGKAPRRTKRRHGLLTSSHFFTKLKKFSSLFNAVGYAAINDELRVGARRHRSTEIARRSGPLRPRVQHAPLTQGWPLTSARETSRLV